MADDNLEQKLDVLERAETALRAQSDVFRTGVGRFWGLLETRDYMRARFAVAHALIKVDVEDALGHFEDMLRLCRSDNLGVRDIIPFLLLQLDREQECYDFLKWWATTGSNGTYNFENVSLPYLNVRGADICEPIDMFCSGSPSLSHLVALTLLKVRLWMDLSAHEPEYGVSFRSTSEIDRPIGRLVRNMMRTMTINRYWTKTEALEKQYQRLCRVVQDANPYFWEPLIAEETPPPPAFFSPGSEEEAALVLHQCLGAWYHSEDAILMIDAETSKFAPVYEGTAAVIGSANTPSECPGTTIVTLETKRGTGNVLPSKFKAPQPNSSPTELFSPCAGRFVRHNNQKQVLVYVDGACANNGQPDPRGGWAVVPGPPANGQGTNGRVVSGRLENKGPFGDNSVATSNRAELRAVIAALRLCDWRLDGYDSLVVATDSSYVVDGATGWVKGWARNGWKTRNGGDVKNKDLWDLLLGEVERWKHKGLRICIWKIDRTLNTDADAAAKQACDGADKTEFGDVVIDSSQTATPTTGPGLHILALCLDYGSVFDECFKGLISQLTSKANFERVTKLDTGIAKLTQEAAPSIIIVADGAISRQRKLWERVIDCLRGGATVILGGIFSSMVNEGEFNRVFAKLGLPWKRGSYHREDVSLCHDVVGARLSSQLPFTYSQKALYVAGVERSSIWYLESEASQEAAVVFAKVGQGKLGYIGDVNGEEASEQVVLAMCGLLD